MTFYLGFAVGVVVCFAGVWLWRHLSYFHYLSYFKYKWERRYREERDQEIAFRQRVWEEFKRYQLKRRKGCP